MDTLAQELIDEIIDNVPRQDMPSSSLVARRWRRKSQQRNFELVLFMFENLNLWEYNIPQDLDGIPSYVRHVRFKCTHFPHLEPGTLSRLAVPLSLGEFGNITRLILTYVIDLFSVIKSFIFSGPLELLSIHSSERINYPTFARLGLASRRLSLNPNGEGIELFIQGSSKTMVALTLIDPMGFRSGREEVPPPIIYLPPLPSLTRVRVQLVWKNPSARLAGLLSSIRSAPKPSSVTFSWVVMDRWLAWMIIARTTGAVGLRVVLAGWLEDNPGWGEYFPGCREAVGELRREAHDYEYCDMVAIRDAEYWRDSS
ncbi:hypothetical protein BJ322DRAFT_1095577 [Thelephora terrestris]|uniref:F-box domain-containing protein n=1 Tax=Thelephora terrestris TaxID=56493 RepID=A0A9P6L1A2_9AGAM|nr:hypothetical protein BJ322DRAFT_1095577 [Thelephora terrestris]